MLTQKAQEETKKAKLENYAILKKNVDESKKILNEYEKFFENGIPEDEEIYAIQKKCLLLEKYGAELNNYEISAKEKNEIENLNKLFKGEKITEEIINNKISEYNSLNDAKNKIEIIENKITNLKKEKEHLENKTKKGQTVNLLICLISIILVMIGVSLFLMNKTTYVLQILVGGGVLFIIFLFMSIIQKGKNKKYTEKKEQLEENEQIQENLQEKIETSQKNISKFIQKYMKDENDEDVILQLTEIKTNYIKYKETKNSINELFKKQSEALAKFNELEENIKEYLLQYFKEIKESNIVCIQEIKLKKKEYLKQKKDYEEKLKEKEKYEKSNEVIKEKTEENKDEINLSKEEIEEKINELSKQINSLNDEKNYNQNQIEMLESNLDTVFDIENELEQISEEIKEMTENCDILEKTKKYLELAKDNFSSHYLRGMQESFIKNIKLISKKDIDIDLDVNLNPQINEQGSSKKIDFFSTGYKDLIYICMRFSLIDSLFETEKPFIILDDPFVNLDENKIKNAMDLLKKISNEYQIIYFICHKCRDYE